MFSGYFAAINCSYPRVGGGYSVFEVTGMIERFFGRLKYSIPGFFGGKKIWQVIFVWLDLIRDFFGYSKQSADS